MQCVLFIGLQASGKTTFFRERFADTHVRLSMDMLRTRHREGILFGATLAAKQPVVIDNTNPTRAERARYLRPAKEARFTTTGFYFAIDVEGCLARNADRPDAARVPRAGLLGTHKRLEVPEASEGFDELRYVRLDPAGGFRVDPWVVQQAETP